jgi:hypothetical protein
MPVHTNTDTRFHIDLGWWVRHGRNLRRYLAEILGDADADLAPNLPMDYIDPTTAEVYQLDPLWVRVLNERANQPGYIAATTPMAGAILRALIENLNQPMTVVQLHRRLNRGTPETLLRLMHTTRLEYGIVPASESQGR